MTQPMTSEKRFPEVVTAVHAEIRAYGLDPADYAFTAAGFADGLLEGAYRPHAVIEAHHRGVYDLNDYVWFAFTARSNGSGPVTGIRVTAVPE